MKSQFFTIIFNQERINPFILSWYNLMTVLATTWRLFLFFFIIFYTASSINWSISFMNSYSLSSRYQIITSHKFYSRMSMYSGRVNVALYWNESFNIIIANTSPDHPAYLTFRVRTNEMGIVFFVAFSPNINTVVWTKDNLTFTEKKNFFHYSSTGWLFHSLLHLTRFFLFTLNFRTSMQHFLIPRVKLFVQFTCWKLSSCTRSVSHWYPVS